LRVGSRELHLQEFEIVGDRVQVAAGLIDLAQRERAFVWHDTRYASGLVDQSLLFTFNFRALLSGMPRGMPEGVAQTLTPKQRRFRASTRNTERFSS
jgi:hypothetical protein